MFQNYNDEVLNLFYIKQGEGDDQVAFIDFDGEVIGADVAFERLMDTANNMEEHIDRCSIPKRRGGTRKIIAPDARLKYYHTNLKKSIFSKLKPSKYAHGFVRKRNVRTNAQMHVGARAMGHMDIKNFFDSITVEHVRNILFGTYAICTHCKGWSDMKAGFCGPSIYKNMENKFPKMCCELKMYAGQQPDTHTSLVDVISRIVTIDGFTPQGFATSPFIANAVLRKFDHIVGKRLEKHGITYTRYADDMTFTHKTESSGFIAKKTINMIPSTLGMFRFKLNKAKTYFITNRGRMATCNVVINKIPNMKREQRWLLKAEIHHLTVKYPERATWERIRELKGKAAYLYMLNPRQGGKFLKQLDEFAAKRREIMKKKKQFVDRLDNVEFRILPATEEAGAAESLVRLPEVGDQAQGVELNG